MSKLILITGAQAVGKMTVGEALKNKTGFSMTTNHDSLELAAKIYGWGTPSHKELSENIRKATFNAAINNDVDLIFTYVWAFNQQEDWEYVENVAKKFDEVYCVELIASQEVRLERNKTENRLKNKASKRDIEASNKRLIYIEEPHQVGSSITY